MAELDDDVTETGRRRDDDVTAGSSTSVLSNVCVDGVSEMDIGARVLDLWLVEGVRVSVSDWSDGGCAAL